MDIPRLKALGDYWRRVPPLHLTVAAFLGAIKDPEEPADLVAASEYIPVNRVSAEEFDALLRQHGLEVAAGQS